VGGEAGIVRTPFRVDGVKTAGHARLGEEGKEKKKRRRGGKQKKHKYAGRKAD
jgi:hypothetical protein